MARRTNDIPTDGMRACWLLIVDRHHFGNRAHVDLSEVDIIARERGETEGGDADKRRLSLSKKLLDCDEVKAINAHFREVAEWLFATGLPSFIRPGMYRIPPGLINTVENKLREFRAQLFNDLVPAAVAVYHARVLESLTALGELGDADDYPSVEEFAACWGLGWRWVNLGVPDALKAVDFELWKTERDKEVAEIRQAAEGVRMLLRQTALTLIRELRQRLGQRDDGKKRILRATALDDLMQFVSAFSFRDVTNDGDLDDLVTQIKELARGVDVPKLRTDDELRTRVERESTRLEGHLDRLVSEVPVRRLRVRKVA